MFGRESFIRKHPRVIALLALGGVAAYFGIEGNDSPPVHEGSRDTGAAHGKTAEAIASANKNPHSARLACQLMLRAAGANYTLQTAITEGTPLPHAQLTYTAKYQAGLSGGFRHHTTEPATAAWNQPQAIPGVEQGQPLATVRGDIGETHCAPASVAEGR